MRSFVCKIGFVLVLLPGYLLAGPGGPPAGSPILNTEIYQRGSSLYVDTANVVGILQIPHGITPPPSFECNVATHTGRIFISTSSSAGMSRIYVCEGVNGWQLKTSTGGSGGGSGIPGGSNTQFQYNNSGSFAGSANLINNTSSVTATAFKTSTLTVSDFSQFLNVSTTVWQSVSTITYSQGILVDMSRISNASLAEGFVIPESTSCANATRNGQICWDSDDHYLFMGNGTSAQFPIPVAASNLAVSQGPVLVTSPTATESFNASQFSVAQVSITTATVALNLSSITAQGNTFNGANQLVKEDANAAVNISSVGFNTAWSKGFQLLPILQVQSATTNTTTLTTSTSYVDSQIKVTITPKSATSKILVYAQGDACAGAGASVFFTLARDGTNLTTINGMAGLPSNNCGTIPFFAYDSPATTSAVVYSVQMKSPSGVAVNLPTSNFGGPNPTGIIVAIEVAQ